MGEGQGGGTAVIIRKGLCPGNRYSVSYSGLKGQSNEIFNHSFLSSFELAWVTDQWVKIFSILVRISLSYSNFF